MTIRLRIISGEDEDFLRDVEISGNATFLDLHNFIQQLLHFDDAQIASFFVTDDEWQKNNEITLIDMTMDETNKTDVMSDTIIKKFIFEHKQRLLYIFDFFNERTLFIEVFEINELNCIEPKCLKSLGNPPKQTDMSDILEENQSLEEHSESDFYSDDLLEFSNFNDDYDPMISYTDNLEDL